MSPELIQPKVESQLEHEKTPEEITKMLLANDRKRAQDVLVQLQFSLSRKVSSMEIK